MALSASTASAPSTEHRGRQVVSPYRATDSFGKTVSDKPLAVVPDAGGVTPGCHHRLCKQMPHALGSVLDVRHNWNHRFAFQMDVSMFCECG